MYILVQIELIH